MFIKKEEFDNLTKERDMLKDACIENCETCDELADLVDNYRDVAVTLKNDKADMKNTIENQQHIIEGLIKTINDIIDITFDGNDCFETVIFQRHGKAPKIYYRGKKITDTVGSEINITYKDGRANIRKTNRFTR